MKQNSRSPDQNATEGRFTNPLEGDTLARRYSAYHGPNGKELTRLLPTKIQADASVAHAHAVLKSTVMSGQHPCSGALSVFRNGDYRFGYYPPMATPAASAGLSFDLYEFNREFSAAENRLYSFIAVFDGPVSLTELEFEHLLWKQLQQLHEIDVPFFDWDPTVARDPQDPQFSFSFGGKAYFIVGLHAAASRTARRFAWPALVFNAHEIFDRLREAGTFTKMQSTIRKRDIKLQGSINPMVQNFGTVSEARQYSGRPVPDDWRCPFTPRHRKRP